MRKVTVIMACILSFIAGSQINYYCFPKKSTLTIHTNEGHPYVATLSRPLAKDEIFLEDGWNDERTSFYHSDLYFQGLMSSSREQELKRINKKIEPTNNWERAK